ncbi:MAG: radical SAM protein [Candidatus Omnitrophica bacterium]|nr:radical SAM protein [Candidatus Omnitrophota bacterium]
MQKTKTEEMTKKRVLFIRTDFLGKSEFRHPLHFTPPLMLKSAENLLRSGGGYETRLIDCSVERASVDAVVREVVSFAPDAVVISFSTYNAQKAWDLASELKKRDNMVLTIAVGHGATSRYTEYLTKESPFDIVLRGEAGKEIVRTIHKLSDFKSPAESREYLRSRGETGETFAHKDLDEFLFPEYSSDELKKYQFIYPVRLNKRVVSGYILSSCGCVHSCIFCTQTVRKSYTKEIRCQPASRVVDEICRQKEIGANFIFFLDDNFSSSREHVISVCDEIISRGVDIAWSASARVDELDSSLLKRMAEAGCTLLLLSVESGLERIIKMLNKTEHSHEWAAKAKEVFAACRESGIGTCALFMVGCPTETRDDIAHSIELAHSLNPDFIKVHSFTPYPGTVFYERNRDKIQVELLDRMHHYLPPLINFSGMDMKLLRSSQRYFYRSFLSRPRYIIGHLRRYFLFYMNNPATAVKLFSSALRMMWPNGK